MTANLDLPITSSVGPYRIIERLGGGGMGVIYRAVHTQTGLAAAVKTVRFPRRTNLSSIRVEIHTLSRLQNPGVVRILDQGIEAGLPWYAMELLEGTTLRDWLDAVWPEIKTIRAAGATVTGTPSHSSDVDTLVENAGTDGLAPPPPVRARARVRAANGRLVETLRTFGKICAPLAFIHGEGIVHRDLKPPNVFLRDDGRPVLVDFGLASVFRGAVGRETLEVGGELMGTVAYISPEQVRAEMVDARADLYAIGCMLYEALTGQVPFSAHSPRETVSKHLYQWPPLPSELASGISPALERLVLSLLEKNPADRVGHADDLAEALFGLAAAEESGGPGSALPAAAPVTVTDSDAAPPEPDQRAGARAAGYLYRPELVGRDDALTALGDAGERAARGSGSLALVLGESGVGKTFLAAEAGRRAQIRGLRMVIGDALAIAPSDGSAAGGAGAGAGTTAAAITGPPFHVFRQFLQTVADLCRESDDAGLFDRLLGERAAILAPYEPALAQLPGQERHAPLPEIPGEATRRRAIQALLDVMAACARERPLCLIIDDLQWADDLSLALLAGLPPDWLADKPILIVATCRAEEMNDEVRALAARADVRRLRLPMLSESAVTSLVAGMLGMKEAPAALVSFLARQTDGNPFFVAEYLRAAVGERLLYRQRGQWRVAAGGGGDSAAFEALQLPDSLQALIERRLDNLSREARDLVKTAAVLGRQLDATLLEAAAGLDEATFLEALGELGAHEILEDLDGARLRFIHDKMREVTYLGISSEERRRRHQGVGEALEAHVRGTPDIQLVYAELAHHFTCAGDTPKAIDYLEKAGQQALASSANREAIHRFHTALTLDAAATPAPGHDATPPRALVRRATWERQIGEAQFALTSLDDSRDHLLRALDELGLPFPRSGPRLFLRVLGEIAKQVLHRLSPWRYVGAAGARAETLAEGARVYETLLQIFYMASKPGPILYGAVRLLNLCELVGPSPALARAYAGIFGTAGVMGLHALARLYLARATEMLQAAPDASSESWVYQLATFYRMGVGAWDDAESAGRRAADAALLVGNRRRWEEAQLGIGLTQLLRGRLADARATFEDMRDSGMKGNHNAEQHAWILLAQVQTRLGDLAGARLGLQRAAAIAPSRLDPTVLGQLQATEALTALALGDAAGARAAADRASASLWSLPPVMNMLIPHLASLCEVYLSLWAQAIAGAPAGGADAAALARSAGPISEMAKMARDACQALRRFVRVFPVVAPIVGVHQGRLAWLGGQPEAAHRRWNDALAAAQRLAMPTEEARAALALGQHGPDDGPTRRQHAERARKLFDEIGMTRERDQADDQARSITYPERRTGSETRS